MSEKSNEVEKRIQNLYSRLTVRGLDYDIKTQLDLNILKALLKRKSTDGQIIKTLKRFKDIKELNEESFVEELLITESNELDEDSKVMWKVYFPLDISIPKQKIQIGGNKYQKKSYKSLPNIKRIEFNKIFYPDDSKYFPTSFPKKSATIYEVEAIGKNLNSAWKRIHPSFAVLKGLIDFTLTYSRWSFVSGGKSRSMLSYPVKIFGLSENKDPEYLEFIVNGGQNHHGGFSDSQKRMLNFFLKILKDTPCEKSIDDLLLDSFRLYHHGMDEKIIEFSFIRFYQLAERLSFPKKAKTNEEGILSRLNILCRIHFKDELSVYIRSLVEKRNDFVHHGIENITEHDLNFMKTLCEYTIMWISYYRKKIRTRNHLDEFYKRKDLNNNDLQVSKEVLKFIDSLRDK